MFWGDGTPNIPGSSDALVVPSPYPGSCCAIVVSRSCRHLVGVGIDLNFGPVHVCRRESPGSGGEVCPATIDCRMAPNLVAKGERSP